MNAPSARRAAALRPVPLSQSAQHRKRGRMKINP
jgi:hypothetical protein